MTEPLKPFQKVWKPIKENKPEINKRIWLCLGSSLAGRKYDQEKCINAIIEHIDVDVPNPYSYSAESTLKMKRLSVYCKVNHHFIIKYTTQCDKFNNRSLKDFVK